MTVVYKNKSNTLFPWKNLTLSAGFTATVQPQYRVIDGICYLRGYVTRNAGAVTTSAEEVLTLPDEACPATYTRLYGYANNNSSLALTTIDVHPDNKNLRVFAGGSISNSSSSIPLGGVSYATAGNL